MKLLLKKFNSKRFIFRRKQHIAWRRREFWISRLLSLFILQGRKNLVLRHYYRSLFALKFNSKLISLLSPLYECLQNALPFIGFVRLKWTSKRQSNPKLRPRIDRPLRCYNLAFRWIRVLLQTVQSVYFFERFPLLTQCLQGPRFRSVMLKKLKHYKLAIINMQYLRVRFFRRTIYKKQARTFLISPKQKHKPYDNNN